jgi:hypothetical protein
VLDELNLVRHITYESLTETLMNLLSQFVQYRCDGALARAGYYAHSLQQLGILPGTKSCQSKTIIHILELASTLAEHHGTSGCGTYCHCWRFKHLEQRRELLRQLKIWDEGISGVCLDCLRSAGNKIKKKCRASPHRDI